MFTNLLTFKAEIYDGCFVSPSIDLYSTFSNVYVFTCCIVAPRPRNKGHSYLRTSKLRKANNDPKFKRNAQFYKFPMAFPRKLQNWFN